MKVASLVLALAAISGTTAAPAEHEVKSLPGWDGELPSKHYSGYIPVGTTSGTPGSEGIRDILRLNPACAQLSPVTPGPPVPAHLHTPSALT